MEIKENKIKNRSITLLLSDVLEFIICAYEKAMGISDLSDYTLKYKCGIEDFAELNENNVHMLFNLIKGEKNGEKNGIVVSFGNVLNEYLIDGYINEKEYYTPNEEERVCDISKSERKEYEKLIFNGFFELSAKERMLSRMREFFEREDELSIYKMDEYMPKENIRKYLSSYYSLNVEFIRNKVLKDSRIRNGIINKLLLLGKDKNNNLNFNSPIVLNNIEKMYIGVLDFYNILFSSLKRGEPLAKEVAYMYKSILIAKVQRIFRWYTYDNGKLRAVAIPPLPYEEQNKFEMYVNTKTLNECNSYEGVGELRFAEKIIDAFQKFDGDVFKVGLIGDINKPVYDLVDYVKYRLSQIDDKEHKIIYHIYTNNKIDSDERKCDEVIFENEIEYNDILRYSNNLQRIIEHNHLILLIDCINLYDEIEVKEEEDFHLTYLKFSSNYYYKYSDLADVPENIFLKNPLDDIYQYMVSYMCTGRLGLLEKNAKQMVINYLSEVVENSNDYKTIYVYVSDLEAFRSIYGKEKYYMRIEQYNEKKIGIIRFSTIEEEKLQNKDSGMIVLSVWQVIKHIALEDRKKIIKEINSKNKLKCEYEDLHNLYIGLDYKNWQEEVNVYYLSVNHTEELSEIYDEWMEYFIDNVFLRIFRRKKGSIYQQYCRNVITSFLYGDAKSIEDMLFVYLLRNNKVDTELFKRMPDNKLKEKIKDELNRKYRFSNKRLYDMAMQCYDVAFVNMLEEFNVVQMFEADGKDKNMLKQELILACENINYTKSNLYSNCID